MRSDVGAGRSLLLDGGDLWQGTGFSNAAQGADMVPIPGTGSVEHLEENVAAAELELTDEEFATLDRASD